MNPISMDQPEKSSSFDRKVDDVHRGAGSHYSALALQIGLSGQVNNQSMRLKVTSGSMLPQLMPGDYINLELAPPESLRCGDIVVFQNDGELVTHRLVSINPHYCLTKGDALQGFDPPIDRSRLLGRVVAFERSGKVTLLRGPRWRTFNRTAGLLNFWEGWSARLAERIFHHGRGTQPPAALSILSHLVSGLLQLPVKILLKLFTP